MWSEDNVIFFCRRDRSCCLGYLRWFRYIGIIDVVSDLRMRQLERASFTDPCARSELIALRFKCGMIPLAFVKVAAHLGDELAISLVGSECYTISCGCNHSSYCYRCHGSGIIVVGSGLIAVIDQVCPSQIPLKIIGKWACDCVDRILRPSDLTLSSRIVNPVRKWLESNTTSIELIGLQQDARLGVGLTDFTVSALRELVIATTQHNESISANRFGHAVSFAYHAKGHKKEERTWQVNKLISDLLNT